MKWYPKILTILFKEIRPIYLMGVYTASILYFPSKTLQMMENWGLLLKNNSIIFLVVNRILLLNNSIIVMRCWT